MQAKFTELKTEFTKLDQHTDVNLTVFINNARVLGQCDWYWQKELKFAKEYQFSQLYFKYQEQITIGAGLEQFNQAVDEGDYTTVCEELKTLNTLTQQTVANVKANNALVKQKND